MNISKEQIKIDLYKKFNQIFKAYNAYCIEDNINYKTKSGKRSRPRLNNNSKVIFQFVVGCQLKNDFTPILTNNSKIQETVNTCLSRRTIFNHIQLLVDAGILSKASFNREFFYLSISENLQKTQLIELTKRQKKEEFHKLLNAYKSDLTKTLGRKNIPTNKVDERYLNITRGVENSEALNGIEKVQTNRSEFSTMEKNNLKDTEKNANFVPEKNTNNEIPPSSDYTGGADFSFIQVFLDTLSRLLYPHLRDYQRSIVIRSILIFNTPKLQDNALNTVIKIYNYRKKNPTYTLAPAEIFFDQTNSKGFFKALQWPDYEAINKKRKTEFESVKIEIKHAKRLYYDNNLDIDKVLQQANFLVKKYQHDPPKQLYVRKSLLPFIESKNNLFIRTKK